MTSDSCHGHLKIHLEKLRSLVMSHHCHVTGELKIVPMVTAKIISDCCHGIKNNIWCLSLLLGENVTVVSLFELKHA